MEMKNVFVQRALGGGFSPSHVNYLYVKLGTGCFFILRSVKTSEIENLWSLFNDLRRCFLLLPLFGFSSLIVVYQRFVLT